MKRIFETIPLGLICFFAVACSSIHPKSESSSIFDAKISFTSSSGKITEFSRTELISRFPKTSLIVRANPGYNGARKEYEGFDIATLLNVIDPALLKSNNTFWLKVTTLDGWTAPPYESKMLLDGESLLAISEKSTTLTPPVSNDGLWSILVTPKKEFYPGPFYLVWNDSGRNPDVLPLQVARIVILLSKPEPIKN